MKIQELQKLATQRLPGGLGIKDAQALSEAAGEGKQAVKGLEKVLEKFGDRFTPKGKSEFIRLLALKEEPAPVGDRVTAKTHAALRKAFNGIHNNLGNPLKAISKSAVFARDVIVRPPPGGRDMFTFTALIPIGTFKPNGTYKDPNKVDEFYIERQGGLMGATAIFGPFTKTAAVGQVAIHDLDNGRTIEVKKGQNLVVALPGNPTTGYKWHVHTDRSFGPPAKTEFLAGVRPRSIGSGGTEQFTWNTAGAFPKVDSEHTVRMTYSRGATGTPSKTFAVTVKIV